MKERISCEFLPSFTPSLSTCPTWATPGQSRYSFNAVVAFNVRRSRRPCPLSMVVTVSMALSQIRCCRGGKSPLCGRGEGHLDVVEKRRLILFDEHQVVAPRIDHLLTEIALAEHGVTGDQSPFENQTLEQPKGCFVLVGLLFAAVGNGHLRERQTRFMRQQREQVHGLL